MTRRKSGKPYIPWEGKPWSPGDYWSIRNVSLYLLCERYGWECLWCGVRVTHPRVEVGAKHPDTFATAEHFIPRSEKGLNLRHNKVLACWNCNTSRNSDQTWKPLAAIRRGALVTSVTQRRALKHRGIVINPLTQRADSPILSLRIAEGLRNAAR